MPDFTSAIYLGMTHPSGALPPWPAMTAGHPAALGALPGERAAERALARRTGAEEVLLARSSLHAFVDLFRTGFRPGLILIDRAAYPVGRWGALLAQARGAVVVEVPHYDISALDAALSRAKIRGAVVLADGFCTGCGCAAPLESYLELARHHGANLLIDDTQRAGLSDGGLLPFCPQPWPPELVMTASLAKGFGVPLTVVAGPARKIAQLRQLGETRLHCSPVTAAEIAALHRALSVDRRRGALLRRQLSGLVLAFRSMLRGAGLAPVGAAFPVVTLALPRRIVARASAGLAARGIHAIARRLCAGGSTGLSFILTVRHTLEELSATVAALKAIVERHHV